MLWGRLEYRTRQLLPWKLLSESASTHKHSVVLDYVSTLNIPTLVLSLKNKEWSIFLVVFGGLLLKLMIAASTCLLTVQMSAVNATANKTSSIVMNEAFDAKNFNVNNITGIAAMTAFATIQSRLEVPGIISEIPAAYPEFILVAASERGKP
jgi:hypothetical protein